MQFNPVWREVYVIIWLTLCEALLYYLQFWMERGFKLTT